MNNKIKNFLDIFVASKATKNKALKIIPFKLRSYVGKKRYFPPVSREWKNSIYVFNQNNLKNLPVFDININFLIKSFFNLYFNPMFLYNKKRRYKVRSSSLNKIYASKAEIKHTNNKAILTVYVYNREKISLLKKIKKLKNSFYNNVKLLVYDIEKIFWFSANYGCASYDTNNMNVAKPKVYAAAAKPLVSKAKAILGQHKSIKALLYKELILLRKYKLKLSLNNYKFEEKLLYKLKNFIIKYYNKKVEFNIVNIKSVVFHSDFFTKILASKLTNRKLRILNTMDAILNKVVLPKVNRIKEKSKHVKTVDLNLLENKFLNLNISSILGAALAHSDHNLSELLNNIYYKAKALIFNNSALNKDYLKIYEIIFNSINYKNIAGIRLEAKGRLSKRYRADRAVFKVRWKGSLENIDSSYKGLSSVNYRGHQKANIDYTLLAGKRRIGAFAVKGWVSGKR